MATKHATAKGAALVTGAGKRLGRTIALALADAGYAVAVHYGTSGEAAHATVAEIAARQGVAAAFPADLQSEQQVGALLEQIAERLGEPVAVVNSASAFIFDEATKFRYASLEQLMRINVAAPVTLAEGLHGRRSKQQADPDSTAVVINLLDQKLFNLNPDFFSYTLSKAALQCATTLLAQALAPFVRVVGIAPGITLASGDQTQSEFEAAHRQTPLQRSSRPEDIASAVLFALSNPAVTGSTLLIDGGQHLVPSARDVMFQPN